LRALGRLHPNPASKSCTHRRTQQMTKTSAPKFVRGLALAAAAMLMLSLAAGQRAQAMSRITPGASPAKAASDGLIQVRGGHGGGHGGGGHGGGFYGGGFHGGGGGMHAFRGGGGGWHGGGGWQGGGMRFGGFHHHHGFAHFHHRRFFYGSYYPSYYPYYYHHRCRVIWTYYGPRRVCGYRHWYRWHHYRRWHHRHYW
jgi:hypothetical protein